MKRPIIISILWLMACGILVYMLMIPDIHWSTSQDKCIKVNSTNTNHSCDNLPKKYNKIYVK